MAAFQAASARAECRPDIRILPDPRTGGYWSDESWKKRAVLKADFWHVLFTQRREDLPLNLWTGGLFFGHVFIVKVPSTVDSDGHQAYRSIFPDAATPDQEMYLLNMFVNGIIRGLIQGTGRVHLGL